MTPSFTARIVALKELIHKLKTASRVKAILEMHSYSIPNADPAQRYVVTYGAGDEPIMTEFYGEGGSTIQATPLGNTQYIFINAQFYGTVLAVSTRPIVSIVAG